MGTWGLRPFENDDAADWVFGLEDDGLAAVTAALRTDEGYLEAPEAAEAVAAAAAVGVVLGVPVESAEEVDEWAAGADPGEVRLLAAEAAAALDRVLDGSELAELHDEAGNDDWRTSTAALRDGLRAAGGS
ncbi:DUF4259 domain-containing protein [Phycicoccus flavus]|uniref:DUF4259 domain-containing protein n=1 Tax=Phycicoccus flavus TaxID=2502783 RepID=UPI000FEC19E6|nr:DUF4259 domain-containing protein [Phycicoccus flavus]NHA66553.1 DUF4259 domain-containing protein [Phycicoccus flavus]